MAALNPVIDTLDQVAEPLRQFYVAKDGKFHVDLAGAPAGFVSVSELTAANAKVIEFRDTNVKLLKEVEGFAPIKTALGDMDAAGITAAKTAVAEVAALKAKGITKPDDLTAAIAAAQKPFIDELASIRTTAKADRDRADAGTLRTTISEKFNKVGGVPNALDYIMTKAATVFEVADGVVKTKANNYSTVKPGEPLSIDEWLTGQMKESDFAFKQSIGGGAGAGGAGGGGGSVLRAGQTILKDPTPQQLGEFAKEISQGKMKVEYSENRV